MTMASAYYSLRRRLISSVLAVICLGLLVQAVVAYQYGREESNEIFDYHMERIALSLRAGNRFASTPDNQIEVMDESTDDLMIQVWDSGGQVLFQSTTQMALPMVHRAGLSTVVHDGVSYRLFVLKSEGRVIQLAQDMKVRSALAGKLALRVIQPIFFLLPVLLLLVGWQLTHSLKPLAVIGKELAAREADDLGPVGKKVSMPAEVQPLVSEINSLLDRLRLTFEKQKNFIADAAHELRTPFAALKIQAKVILRARTDEERNHALDRLDHGINRAARLIDQMLQLAQQQAVHSESPDAMVFDPAESIKTAANDLALIAHEKNLHIELGLAENLKIFGNEGSVRIMLKNLIDNAIKHAPVNGHVKISLGCEAMQVMICIEDNGSGIKPEHREKVFDRFVRVSDPHIQGSGLGLSIVKSVVEAHKGHISLGESANLGGLLVNVSFPAAELG